MSCLFLSGALLAMGTPPQTGAKPAVETGPNAVMLKTDVLRAAPNTASAELVRLEKGLRVRLLTSQGGWSQISRAGQSGWVRLLSVRSEAHEGVNLADLGAMGKTPQGKVVAVAGTRGLDEEKLGLSTYNAAEIERLQRYAMSRGEAEQFALAAGLQVRVMSYLAAPK